MDSPKKCRVAARYPLGPRRHPFAAALSPELLLPTCNHVTCRKEFEVALYHYEAAVKHADEDLAQVRGRGVERAFPRPGPGAGKGGWAVEGAHRAIGPATQLRSQFVPSPLLNLPLLEPSPSLSPCSSRMPSSTFRS